MICFLSGLIAVFGLVVFLVVRSSKRTYAGRILLPLFFLELSLFFLILALGFPQRGDVGPTVVPVLWITGVMGLSILLLTRGLLGKEEPDPAWGRVDVVLVTLAMTIGYLLLMQVIGYIVATLIYIFSSMYYLSYRNWKTIGYVAVGWIAFSYFAFYRLLYVPLPKGSLIEWIFG